METGKRDEDTNGLILYPMLWLKIMSDISAAKDPLRSEGYQSHSDPPDRVPLPEKEVHITLSATTREDCE